MTKNLLDIARKISDELVLDDALLTRTVELSAEHRQNLYILAGHLLTRGTKNFSMARFATLRGFSLYPYDGTEDSQGKHPCGTVHCAMGSAVEIEEPQFAPKPNEDWLEYSVRVFGLRNYSTDPKDLANLWVWLFSGHWKYTDNTPTGAAIRILFFLRFGLPANWLKQADRTDPLCYDPILLEKIS